jgi:hypothetical protein
VINANVTPRLRPTAYRFSAAEDVEDDAGEERDRPVVPSAEPLEVRRALHESDDQPDCACHRERGAYRGGAAADVTRLGAGLRPATPCFSSTSSFNTVLGEDLLFRGFLLPRMNGSFGRGDWIANGLLFTGYHLHVPWGMPATLLDMFFLAYPTKRYRSPWIGIAVHSAQSVVLAILILTLVA